MKEYTIIKPHQVVRNECLENGEVLKAHYTGDEDMQVSDGYHTMDELYDHRITIFIALCRFIAKADTYWEGPICPSVWRSKNHSDGEPAFGGTWFVLGIGWQKGDQITYHLPINLWESTHFAETLDKAPEFDGHSSADVLERLKSL